MVTTVFTVLPATNALAIFGPRFNLSGHGLAPVALTFDPHDRSTTTLTKTRTFQAGPTEGRAFFFLRRADDCVNGSPPWYPCALTPYGRRRSTCPESWPRLVAEGLDFADPGIGTIHVPTPNARVQGNVSRDYIKSI